MWLECDLLISMCLSTEVFSGKVPSKLLCLLLLVCLQKFGPLLYLPYRTHIRTFSPKAERGIYELYLHLYYWR